MIKDLMGDDSTVSLIKAYEGYCPACHAKQMLYKLVLGKDVVYICIECLRTALKLLTLRANYKPPSMGV